MDDEKVDAVVLTGDENYFSAGADLKTLDSNFHKYGSNGATRAYVEAYGTGENIAPFVYALDQARKPVIALIAGVCFGGGLEVALGCHYRVCYENASFRFPEVFVGIVPGSLGTQYLPRLADFKLSIDMAVLGKPVDARTALQSGLVDHVIRFGDVTGKFAELVVQTHLIVGAILNDASGSKPFRRTSSLPVKVSLGDAMVMCFKVSQRLPPVNKGGLAQRATLECLLACVRAGDSFLRGAVWESEVSRAIIASREAQALRYVFLSGTYVVTT
jgi:3-hydroxyacyl-CoA dehydrogenase